MPPSGHLVRSSSGAAVIQPRLSSCSRRRIPISLGGVLAFSPAENFATTSVHVAAAKVKCPVFIASSPDPGEVGDAKKLLDAVTEGAKTQLIPKHGLSGSASL